MRLQAPEKRFPAGTRSEALECGSLLPLSDRELARGNFSQQAG